MQATSETIASKLKVAARCTPEAKLKIVKDLKKAGKIVAVTGSGSSDAPALKEADIGFAQGINGTDIAKSASDVIMMDDSLSSIVSAILLSRDFLDKVLKFLQYHVAFIIVVCLFVPIGVVITGDETLSAMQLLWIGVVFDVTAPLAFAGLKPFMSALNTGPRSQSVMVSAEMWRNIIGQVLIQLAILLVLLFKAHTIFDF